MIPVTGAILREAESEGRRIKAAKLVTRHGDVTIRAEGFADCSGDAALAYLARLTRRGLASLHAPPHAPLRHCRHSARLL